MKLLKYLILCIIVVITLTVGRFVYQWMGKGVNPFEVPRIIPDIKIEGVRLMRAVAGKKEWELRARSAEYFRNKGVTHLELPEVVFYGKGEKRIELKGNTGEVFDNTNDIAISGDIKIVTSDGYTFRSDFLRYLSAKKVVTTESRVTARGNGIEVEGLGMLVDIEQDRIFIKKDVKAVLEGSIKNG